MKTTPPGALLTDLYEINMMYAHFQSGNQHRRVVFDLFFREAPHGSGFALVAGLEPAVAYLQSLRFTAEELAYLAGLGLYRPAFLAALAALRFTGSVDAMPEGSVAFPGEPILRITAPVLEAQLVETALLNLIGHQTLIATKAYRVVHAAGDDPVMEFGLRRAQGPDAAVYGARAAIIGGCQSTSNVTAAALYDVPASGTQAHAWVQFFDDELTAFRAYAAAHPDRCLLLVDTYDTLRSGVPNAITVGKELEAQGHRFRGIRLDSGDLAFLSKKARAMLDAAGLPHAQIVASSDLDEFLIRDLKAQGARIDAWGVGTQLITGGQKAALGAVYKLAAVEENGQFIPRLKISENPAKVTNPGVKRVLRLFDEAKEGKAAADLLVLADEVIDTSRPLEIFDPIATWKRKRLTHYRVQEMLLPIIRDGELVADLPALPAIAARARENLSHFWEEQTRLVNPEPYPVDLSQPLWQLKHDMLHALRNTK